MTSTHRSLTIDTTPDKSTGRKQTFVSSAEKKDIGKTRATTSSEGKPGDKSMQGTVKKFHLEKTFYIGKKC